MNTLLRLLFIICLLSVLPLFLQAQDMDTDPVLIEEISYEEMEDSVRTSRRQDPDKLFDIRQQLERQNQEYYVPSPPTREMIEAMQRNRTTPSEEVLFWSRNRMDPNTYFSSVVNFTDTVIYNPFLLPPVFRKKYITTEYDLPGTEGMYKKVRRHDTVEPDTTFFRKERKKIKDDKRLYNRIAVNQPQYFKYTEEVLPDDVIKVEMIKKEPATALPLIVVKPERQVTEIAPPAKFIPDRMYWTSQFESAVQFSQNYVSPNWHKGGSSNLNLYTKNHLRYNYSRDKIQFTNELEDKISIYNATKDTLHRYKIGEDLLRIYSNFGYQAFNKWYYTIDGEFRTQLFRSYEENKDTQLAGFLAPMRINLGIGMKYDLFKEFPQKGKNLQLTVNMAPFSYTYMYSRKKDIDLGRHGFQKDEETGEFENTLSQIGSTLRADMTVNFNPNITWQSRLYYFTTYEKAICEFENTLVLAITRHFSTRIYMHLRFDDSVVKTEDFDSYFQLNELLSFGFNYKW